MSRGDDVLDSWEEIDEAGLSTQLNQIKKDLKEETEAMSFQNGVPLMVVMRPDDEYGSNYTQPAKPAVKILRRPPPQTSQTKSVDVRPKQPIKTLQQREQEYAEARLRILGSAKNPEDDLESSLLSKLANKPEESQNEGFSMQTIRLTNEILSPSSYLNGQLKMPDSNVLRMPKGPDGTSGFNIRR